MSNPAAGYAFVVLAVLCWAGNAVIGRLAPDSDIPPLALNFWRWMVALVVLLPFAIPALRTQWGLLKAHWRLWTVFGAISVAGFNSAFYIALQSTTVVQGTIITAILPILVLIAARFLFAQPITIRQLAGVMISILGVVVIVIRGDLGVLETLVINTGDVWMLLAVGFWASQTILIRYLPKGVHLIAFQVVALAVGLTVLAPLYIGETVAGRPMPLTLEAALSVAYTGLIASVAGFTLWNMGVVRIGPKTAGYFGNLFPMFGAALGILLLGEQFHLFHVIGGIAILAGIYLATVTRAAARADPVASTH